VSACREPCERHNLRRNDIGRALAVHEDDARDAAHPLPLVARVAARPRDEALESLFGRAPGGPPPKGSVAGIVDALLQDRVARVLSDRVVSPTFVIDAAFATRELLARDAEPGLYHCVNSGHATWLDFASEAARLLGVQPRFEVLRFADVKLPAARPQYCALSNAKLAAIGIAMPSWQDALGRYIESLVASR